jgi:hypothetical protein
MRKVHVPQTDGEIVFTSGDGQRRFVIDDHLASPRTVDEQQQLLALVDGARLATAKEAGSAPAKTDSGADGAAAKPKE